MIVENKPNFYIGTITYVENDPLGLLTKDKLYHEAVVAVPGVFENVLAFPARTNLDEPKVGDLVVVCSWDPTFNSYCTYEKLKEDDFVGFRAHGKMVKIDHEKIVVGVFDEQTEYKDPETPDVTKLAHLEMDKDGNITVHAAKDITVNGDANCTITIKGDTKITVEGNSDIEVKGNATTKVTGNVELKGSQNITIDGGTNIDIKAGSTLTTKATTWIGNNGTVTPAIKGAFCGIPICPLTGSPHAGNISSGGG